MEFFFFGWTAKRNYQRREGGQGREGGKAREKETNVRDKRANDTQDRDRLTGFPRRGTRQPAKLRGSPRGLFKPIPPIGSCSALLNPPGNFLRPCLPSARIHTRGGECVYHRPRHLSQIKPYERDVASSFFLLHSLFFVSLQRGNDSTLSPRVQILTPPSVRITSQLFRDVTNTLVALSRFFCYIYSCGYLYTIYLYISSSSLISPFAGI